MSVGHLARILESAGFSTVIIAVASFAPTLIRMKVPRALVTPHPMGRPLGRPGDHKKHLRVLSAALDLFDSATNPGDVVEFGEGYLD